MANLLENYGIDFISENEDTFTGFLGYLVEKGKAVRGYRNDWLYLYKSAGDVEFWVRVKKDEDEKWNVEGLDSHCTGRCVWEMYPTGIDITAKDSSDLKRTLMFNNANGNGGLVPIEIINADVLPRLCDNDKIKMQVVALPLEINYFSDEDAYADTQPDDKDGKKWLISNGSMLALSFLCNHAPDEYEEGREYESDKYVHFCATVKEVYHGRFNIENADENTFVRCIAETMFGDIEFDHTVMQVPEEQRINIKPGSVVSGVCIISADAAIYEYSNGAVKDFDNDIRLLCDVFEKGNVERLSSILSEKSVLTTYSSDIAYQGTNEIIERFALVRKNCPDKCMAHIASIVSIDEEDTKYSVGTQCIVLSYGEKDNYEALVFVSTDDDGKIEDIEITNDSKYHFQIHTNNVETPLDNIEIPDSVIEPIIFRAKFHSLISPDVEPQMLIESIGDYASLESRAQRMLSALGDDWDDMSIGVINNIMGYLFAKSIEIRLNEHSLKYNGNFKLSASYNPDEAIVGEISSTLDADEHKILEESMDVGKQFAKDVFVFMKMNNMNKEQFPEIFMQAAVVVQKIGELYADKIYENRG